MNQNALKRNEKLDARPKHIDDVLSDSRFIAKTSATFVKIGECGKIACNEYNIVSKHKKMNNNCRKLNICNLSMAYSDKKNVINN